MKILKVLLYILLALILVLVLLGFVGPKSYDVSRTIEINAPVSVAFAYLKSLKKQNEWGPWSEMDTTMQVSYYGEDGTVGFVSRWDGEKAGKGEQRISSISGTTVETDLTFNTPWGDSKSVGYLHAANVASGTEVTWGFRGENNFIGRIFGVFMNMEKGVGPMFEKGLQNLKQMIESDISKEYRGHKVNIVDFPVHQYVAARGNVPMDGIAAFFGQHSGRIVAALNKANVSMTGVPTGLYFTWDEQSGTTDMAVGIPVSGSATVPNTEMMTVPAGKALTIDYHGSYDGLQSAHLAIDEFINSTGVQTKMPVIEEYVTDPQAEPDMNKWLTKIYYLLDQ